MKFKHVIIKLLIRSQIMVAVSKARVQHAPLPSGKNRFFSEGKGVGGVWSQATVTTIGDEIDDTLSSNGRHLESKTIHTPPPSPPFKVGVFVVFYR